MQSYEFLSIDNTSYLFCIATSGGDLHTLEISFGILVGLLNLGFEYFNLKNL